MRRVLLAGAVAATAAPVAHDHHGAGGCNTRECHIRVDHRQARAKKLRIIRPHRWFLAKLRGCEVQGQPHPYRTNTGNGFLGAYQFTLQSWRAVGGKGSPHTATPLEQDYRAVLLLRLQGPGAWPVCSR